MQLNDYIHSVNLNQQSDFPYLVLNVVNGSSYPQPSGFRVMHWHEDLQFIYVEAGELEITTLETRMLLRQNEGIFINKNVVHMVRQLGLSHHRSFVFPAYFLGFYFGSPAAALVAQIVGQEALPIIPIVNRPENRAVLENLRRLSALEEHKTALYPYEVLTSLCTLWLSLCRTVTVPVQQPVASPLQVRMSAFLRYIEQHYSETISLDALAQSANVSKSECLRCFKASLQTTPYKYLIEYRLSRAAELLRTTNEPISSIASSVGFQQTSHFGRCFREKLGLSPRAYRRLQ